MEPDGKNDVREAPCLPCETFLGGPEPEACMRFQDYLTPEEEEVLAMLRKLKKQARDLKGKMQGYARAVEMELMEKPAGDLTSQERQRRRGQRGIYEEWQACQKQLDDLRLQWKDLEKRKEEAHHRKMVLLGHRPWEEESRI